MRARRSPRELVTQTKAGRGNEIDEVSRVKVTVLVENSVPFAVPVAAEHGLSMMVQVEGEETHHNILLDTGSTAETLFQNMAQAGFSVDDIDMIFLSHCHHDHTGGLLAVLENKTDRVPVVAHPQLLRKTFKLKNGLHSIGLPGGLTRSDLEKAGADLFLAADPVEIFPGAFSTGCIPRQTEFEQRTAGFYRVVDQSEPGCDSGGAASEPNAPPGRIQEDLQEDDLALGVKVKQKGLVVLTGCGHAGIINTVRHASQVSGSREIYAVIGGFHLNDAREEVIERTVSELSGWEPSLVSAGHCTGFHAVHRLYEELGERFSPLGVGKTFEL